ncbi:14052_t:CDS:2, partial [Funneliformis geosporum]
SEDYDVIIRAGEYVVKELQTHLFVLHARCSYFKRTLSKNWEKKDEEVQNLEFSLHLKNFHLWKNQLLPWWLFVHYLKIGKDDSEWSSEDYANIKQTMQEYIPLIRFYDISKEDVYLKVYPYKDFLSQDLLSDILRRHMVSDSTPALSRVFQNHKDAVFYHSIYGPTFGGGYDLSTQGGCSWNVSNRGHAYIGINIPSSFTIDEYEIFQVVLKS